MKHATLTQPAEAVSTGRYQVSVTLGLETVTRRTDDLILASQVFEAFKADHAGDKEAHGAVYDFATLRQLERWWGKPPEPRPVGPASIFAKAIASGAPVSIITGGRATHFNIKQEG